MKYRVQDVTIVRTTTQTATVRTLIPFDSSAQTAIRVAEAIADGQRAWGPETVEVDSIAVSTIGELESDT